MNYVSAEQDNIDMMLTQMGAKVKSIHGLICSVRFNIDGTELFYVYNVNAKEQYYLQKVLPYPVGAGEFTKPSEIIEYIKKDIACYKTASKSTIFKEFVSANLELHHTIHKLEDTFMSHNVPHDKMDEIVSKIEQISQLISEIEKTSKTL